MAENDGTLTSLHMQPATRRIMAYDAYLAFSGNYGPAIKGESTRKGFENWIEIDYFDFDIQQKLTIGSQTTGAGAGKVQFGAFQVRKQPDSSSPLLFQACAAGTPWEKATLALHKAGGESTVNYLRFEFQLVALQGVHWTGDTNNGDTPSEVLAFMYGALHVTYTPQKIDGTAGAAIVGGWNQIKNEKI
jgi:type VI secretion system Hcp family effector